MRKTTFVRTLSCLFILSCLIAFGMIFLPAFAQNTTPATSPATNTASDSPAVTAMPSDPKELMLLAAKSNGMIGDDMKPWHLKITYKYLDDQGNVADQGIYEEYWVSQTKYKLTYTSKNGSRTEYGTDKGILNSDNEKPLDTHDMRRWVLGPTLSVDSVKNSDYILRQDTVDGEKLNCLRKQVNGNPSGFTYCLGTQTAAVQTIDAGTERILRRNMILFQDHYLAKDMQI